MEVKEPTRGELSKEEQERLDGLLGAARRFHYWAFILAGLSLLVSSLEGFAEIELPIVKLSIPALQANVGIYVLVQALTIATERLYSMARGWLSLDTRRPPFAWVALSSRRWNGRSVLLWLALPAVLCAIATGVTLGAGDLSGLGLASAGALVVLIPGTAGSEWYLLRNRLDHRGGPATFSIWLLYWYRFVRLVLWSSVFFLPVPAVVPRWRHGLLTIIGWCLLVSVPLMVARFLAGLPPLYRRIDRAGRRFGFPTESKHYD
jgi:hypothetical protein